ncbi:MAG: acyltransferase [Verrucomicrobiota bacterium]
MNSQHSQRFAHLDSIRGIAAIAVLLHHAIFTFRDGNLPWFFEYFDLGKFGVFLFFALSGAVIPFSLRAESIAPVRSFIIGRFFRLYPMYWVSLFLGLLVLHDTPHSTGVVVANITMLQGFLRIPDILGVYWTLQIEWVFYGLCLAFFCWKPKEWLRKLNWISLGFLFGALILAVARFVLEKKLPVALPLALSVMYWGTLCRMAGDKSNWTNVRWVGVVIALVIVPVSLLAYNKDYGFGERWYRYVISYWGALGVFYVWVSRVRWSDRVTVFLGRISYSVYLVHLLVIEVVGRSLFSDWAKVWLVLLLSVMVASVSYYFVELPFLSAGALWVKRFRDFHLKRSESLER